jgi:hypothetical protein
MKKFWYLLLLPLFMGLTACNDDDDDDNSSVSNASEIIGMWELSNVKGTLVEDGVKETFDVSPQADLHRFEEVDVADYTRWVFNDDKTFIGYEYDNGVWSKYANITYNISGNKLTLKNIARSEVYTIKTLNATTLVVYFEESDDDYSLSMDVTYKKIQ